MLGQQDKRLIYIQDFNATLSSLRNEMTILEFEDGKYIQFEYFHSVYPEYTKESLNEYVEKTIAFAPDKEFFTIKSLKQDGFEHELHNIAFNDWFNSALIKNSRKISFVRVGGTVLFYRGSVKNTTIDFIKWLLKQFKSMDIYKLVNLIASEYGITITKDKLARMIKNSDMYYSDTLEKAYLSKSIFYEDL